MTPSLLIRPVLALFLTAGVSACGMVESDPHRFESLANRLASVPVDGSRPADAAPAPIHTAGTAPRTAGGLRSGLRVEVLDDMALWDARYGVMGEAGPVVVEAAADEGRARLQRAVDGPALRRPAPIRVAAAPTPRPASRPASAPAARPLRSGGLVQLGAFSSRQSADAAWSRLKSGGAGWALDGLTPTFEAVSVNGRDLVRLKVRTPAAGAAAVCAAAGIDDPWCRRSA
ncbi:MAG: hypothetical protein EON85_02940 [Brevundimonas sp.]|nr:MAG: hypothetical protein EON85_02940 [Brevundimonas sp.]